MPRSKGHTGANQVRLQTPEEQMAAKSSVPDNISLDDLIDCCDDCCDKLEKKGCHHDVVNNIKTLKSQCVEARDKQKKEGMKFDPSILITLMPLFIQLMNDFAKFFPHKPTPAPTPAPATPTEEEE